MRKGYAATFDQSAYDIDSLATLGENTFAEKACIGTYPTQEDEKSCKAFRGCNRDKVDADVCDTSAGLLKNYCASATDSEGGIKYNIDGSDLPVCSNNQNPDDCVAGGGIFDYVYDECVLMGTASISGLTMAQVPTRSCLKILIYCRLSRSEHKSAFLQRSASKLMVDYFT